MGLKDEETDQVVVNSRETELWKKDAPMSLSDDNLRLQT